MSFDEEQDFEDISTTLIHAAQMNEANAWNRLDSVCRPLVRRWFQSGWMCKGNLVAHDPQLADELAQNVLTKAMLKIDTFSRTHGTGNFKSWLYSIARRESVDNFRKQQRPTRAAKDVEHVEQGRDIPEAPPEESQSELEQMLARLLDVVREDVKDSTYEAFERMVVGGEDSAEVALALGMKKSTVREAKRRVLKRIRDEWGELFGDWPFDHIGPGQL